MVKNDYICNMEEFRAVKGYEGLYEVSNLGRVKSLRFDRDKILKNTLGSNGYYDVGLSLNKKKKTKRVHQLVAESFLGHKPCGMELVINHIDFNKTNNNIANLEIVTQRENTNQKHLKSSSKYTGVSWNKVVEKWNAIILVNRKVKNLGFYNCEAAAHLAYERELKIILS